MDIYRGALPILSLMFGWTIPLIKCNNISKPAEDQRQKEEDFNRKPLNTSLINTSQNNNSEETDNSIDYVMYYDSNCFDSYASMTECFCSLPDDLMNSLRSNVSMDYTGEVRLHGTLIVLDIIEPILSIAGFICNLVTIVIICVCPRLRKPFYMSILSLSLSDLLYLVSRVILLNSKDGEKSICHDINEKKLLNVIFYSTKMLSKLNVVILASVRFAMFVYPLKSRLYLTKRLIALLFIASMAVSIAYGNLAVLSVWSMEKSNRLILYILDDSIMLLALLVMNCTFLVRRLAVASKSQAASHLRLRMTVIVIIILILNTMDSIVNIVWNVYGNTLLLFKTEQEINNYSENFPLLLTAFITGNVVHSVNPLLYFFSSTLVIRGLLSCKEHCKS